MSFCNLTFLFQGKFCNKFHSKYELSFDKRNYGKLFKCPKEQYCNVGLKCPFTHEKKNEKIEKLRLETVEISNEIIETNTKNEEIKLKL